MCTPAYSATLERVPESAATARYLVRSALDAWHLPGLRDSAAHIMSELVANAVRHARGRLIRVTVTRTRRCRVRLAVVDFDAARFPRAVAASPDDERGRGLGIVAELAESWGVRSMSNRKQVWADVEQTKGAT
ncbi:ATP-binding protein [Streptomyces sp. NPDC088745]|uniref:ATP-binding protein n=1 Tax=Streptomyces sp. NPDC088745 TaxID=3365884 RepID=UPI0037F8880F